MYSASVNRYEDMSYRRCGSSGLLMSEISLGLWSTVVRKDILHSAFDYGITHFDLVNSKDSILASVEENFGEIFKKSFSNYRDEIIISTKSSCCIEQNLNRRLRAKNQLITSLDQSLKRMDLDYVDVFYYHNSGSEMPLEETMSNLDLLVKQGKALYVGLLSDNAEERKKGSEILRNLGTPHLIHQPKHHMMESWNNSRFLEFSEDEGIVCIPFFPLEQEVLTSTCLNGFTEDLTGAKASGFLQFNAFSNAEIKQAKALNEIAVSRNQTLAQMTVAWLLKHKRVCSVLVGVTNENQLLENLGALRNRTFSVSEINGINAILKA